MKKNIFLGEKCSGKKPMGGMRGGVEGREMVLSYNYNMKIALIG